jgi:hypothetical protein
VAYDVDLAERVYRALEGREGVTEREMFGGIGYLLHGNMCVGVWKDELIVRLGPEHGPAALAEEHTHPFDVTGRPMRGWLLVGPPGTRTDGDVERWVDRALGSVWSLPPK